jgi:hypothetical protein
MGRGTLDIAAVAAVVEVVFRRSPGPATAGARGDDDENERR